MPSSLPPGAVVRLSHASFDPARYDEVETMAFTTAEYLKPAIGKLPGLMDYYVAVSRAGSFVHVSLWESEAAAQQMASLKEMVAEARPAAEAVGVHFTPIVDCPVVWTL
jgi:hypothetical protein